MLADEAVEHAQALADGLSDGDCPCCRRTLVESEQVDGGIRHRCRGCHAEFVNGDGRLEFDCRCGHIQCLECGNGAVSKEDNSFVCLNCESTDIGTLHAYEVDEEGHFRNTTHGFEILQQLKRREECPCCEHWEIRHVPGATMGWTCAECGAAAIHDEENEFQITCTCDEEPTCVDCGSHIITIEEDDGDCEIECEVCDAEITSPATI